MQRLISELRRLFLLPDAPYRDIPSHDNASPDALLQRQLAGQQTAALPLLDEQGRTRLMVVGFHGVPQGQGASQCSAMLLLAKALMEELELPEPAFSVNGREGFELWLSLAEPVPASEAGEFLGLLKESYLKGLPAVMVRPPSESSTSAGKARLTLPPALHPDTGLWSVFVTPGLATSFIDEAGIDIQPNVDKQADLLAKLEPIAPDVFRQALEALRQRRTGTAPQPLAQASSAPNAASIPRSSVAPPSSGAAPLAPSASEVATQGCLPGALMTQRAELFHALARPTPAVVDTPLPNLSRLLHGGFRGGRLYALLAPPKSGKTTLAASWLDHAAANGHPALYVGYEMAREQLVHAALARRLRLEACRIEARTLTADEAARVAATLDSYLAREGRALEIWEAGPATGLADIATWVQAARAELPGRTPLVVIDPLPLASSGLPATGTQPGTMGHAAALAGACKDLARRTGAAVIALGALSRPLEREADIAADPEAQALLRAADGVLVLKAGMPALQDVGYLDSASPARVRLQLVGHRGRIGEVALSHWRAFHLLEEAPSPSPDLGSAADSDTTEAVLQVFQRHADMALPQAAASNG